MVLPTYAVSKSSKQGLYKLVWETWLRKMTGRTQKPSKRGFFETGKSDVAKSNRSSHLLLCYFKNNSAGQYFFFLMRKTFSLLRKSVGDVVANWLTIQEIVHCGLTLLPASLVYHNNMTLWQGEWVERGGRWGGKGEVKHHGEDGKVRYGW